MQSRPWPKLLLYGILLVALQNLIHIVASVLDPLQLDYSEGLVVSGLERILRQPALSVAYSFNPTFYNTTDLAYPPVFPYAATGLAELLRALPGLPFPALYAARLLTLIGLGVTVWLVYCLIRLRQPDRLVAASCASLFFCFHPAIYWGVYARVDALGLAFSLAGLYVVAQAEFNQSLKVGRVYGLTIVLCGLAFFTKQSLIAVPAAITLYLFLTGRGRQAFMFAGGLGLLVAASIGGLAFATDGKYLFFLTLERFTPFSWPKMLKTWGLFLLLYGPICAAAVWQARPSWREGGGARLIVIWGGLATLVSLTVGKEGAADYYFFEVMTFLAVMLGWLTVGLPRLSRPRLLGGLAVLQVLLLAGLGVWLDYPSNDRDAVRAADAQAAHYVTQYAAPDQKIFVEMSGPAIAAGRPDQVFDHFIFRQLARAGQRDGQALVADFANQRFKLALFGYDILHDDYRPDVTEFTPWPPGFEGTVRANYRLLQDIRGSDGRPYAWALIPR